MPRPSASRTSSAASARICTRWATPPALVKRALFLMDSSVGASRQPALLPDPAQDAAILQILRSYGLAG